MNFKIVPISEEIGNEVRRTLRSPQYGDPVTVSVATGYGPCRTCLQQFDEGRDERILFTYNSFEGIADLPLPGPVFVHKNECGVYNEIGFPPGLRGLPLLFEAFAGGSDLVKRKAVDFDDLNGQIERILNNPDVQFINIRNSEAGCFVARVDRI